MATPAFVVFLRYVWGGATEQGIAIYALTKGQTKDMEASNHQPAFHSAIATLSKLDTT